MLLLDFTLHEDSGQNLKMLILLLIWPCWLISSILLLLPSMGHFDKLSYSGFIGILNGDF